MYKRFGNQNEMLSLGVNFKVDHDNIVDDIRSSVTGEPTLIIFDDLIGSSSLKEIANLFTVDARHINMSLVFLLRECLLMMKALDKFLKIVIILSYLKTPETHRK